MAKKTENGFDNDAAEKIWTDHIGNNLFVQHRDQCALCLATFKANQAGQPFTPSCAEGERVFDMMLEEVDEKIDEVTQNQN
jgi:hypothetical protein